MRAPKYLVVISDKQAELHALASMASSTRDAMAPLIDLRNPRPGEAPKRGWSPERALADHIQGPKDGIMGCWGTDDEVLIDGRRLDPTHFDSGHHPMDYAITKCVDAGVVVVPITSRSRPQAYRDAVARWVPRLRVHDRLVRAV